VTWFGLLLFGPWILVVGFVIGRWLTRSPRTIFGCGNCRETFRSEAELDAHRPCPLVVLEREIAEWNRDFLRRVADDEAAAAEFTA
jgi:hypothetical protein